MLRGRAIKAGVAEGTVLFTEAPLAFFGMIDPGTGVITDSNHPLKGESVAGRILVFPHAKGSTVGSYTIYALARNGKAPAGMVMASCEAIVAAGAVMAGIPAVDLVDIRAMKDWTRARISGMEVGIA